MKPMSVLFTAYVAFAFVLLSGSRLDSGGKPENKKDQAESKQDRLEPGKKVAILVAIKNYQNEDFDFPDMQPQELVKELSDLLGRLGFEIKVLISAEPRREGGDDANLPNRANIVKGIKQALTGLKDRDLLLFYFCGHGNYVEQVGSVLLPYDYDPKAKADSTDDNPAGDDMDRAKRVPSYLGITDLLMPFSSRDDTELGPPRPKVYGVFVLDTCREAKRRSSSDKISQPYEIGGNSALIWAGGVA